VLTDAGYAVAWRKRPAPPEAEGMQRMDTLDALQLLEGIPVRPGTVLGALVVALRRPQGATNLQLMVTTGWQSHSVRGAISGLLRKQPGHECAAAAQRRRRAGTGAALAPHRMGTSPGRTRFAWGNPTDGVTKREGTIDRAGQPSRVAGFLQTSRDVTLPVQHTPDVDVVEVLDVEDQIAIPRQRPAAKVRQVQLVGVSRRASVRMPADVAVRVLQGVDAAERGGLGAFGQVVGDRVLDVPIGLLARDDGLGLHDWRRVLPATLAAPRTRSRKPSK
jgi:hypothetical protein